jgi:hypothetical protein
MKQYLFSSVAVAALLLYASSADAQVSFGPRVGLNATKLSYNFNYDGGEEPKSKFVYGAQAGLSLNVQFGNLSVQPSLLFSMKGDKVEETGTERFSSGGQTVSLEYKTTHTVRLNYLELPINLVYSTNGAEGGFQVFAGPYVGLGLSGKYKSNSKATVTMNGTTTTESDSEEADIEFTNEEGDDDSPYLRRLDAGVNMGVGYKVGAIQAQLGYGLGLGNLVPNDSDGNEPDYKVHNRGFQLSLAYFFE